jgi:PAS domain-containing protein
MEKIQKLEQELMILRQENTMLRSFMDTSRDALFCIEFTEPIDLTTPESEVIRQVFENECVWRKCNPAMARLYKLPEGLDFNTQNVHFVFSRNPENEEFVRTLIKADFHIDGVLSLDQDYDGREVFMENDVRAQIEDGMLLRMFGAVRSISQQNIRDQALNDRLDALSSVLNAIPDPVRVVNASGMLRVVGERDPVTIRPVLRQTVLSSASSRPLKEQVAAFERSLIDNAIDRLGSKRKAARALGVDIGTIVRKTKPPGGYPSP